MNLQQLQSYSVDYLETLLTEQEATIRAPVQTPAARREQMEAVKLKRAIQEALRRKHFEGLRVHVLPADGGMRLVWA